MATIRSRATQALRPARRIVAQVINRLIGTITRVETTEPIAALTFDDGPHPVDTLRMLAVLERHGAKGTFFVIGSQAAAHPEVIERIVAGGHVVANHTYTHLRMPQAGHRRRLAELRRCRQVLGAHGARLFRPPFGGQDLGSRIDALLVGYDVVTWSMHAEDWAGHTSAAMANRLERQIKPGSIILLHDSLNTPRVVAAIDRGPTIAAVDSFLAQMSGRYQFVTVPELLHRGTPVRTRWFQPAQ